MKNEKCGCGKAVRYYLTADINSETGGSCNKYMRCPTYDELSETAKKRAEVILFALGLIKLSEAFDINLGKGWKDFKAQANAIGLSYPILPSEENAGPS